jgi:hypothetical protein
MNWAAPQDSALDDSAHSDGWFTCSQPISFKPGIRLGFVPQLQLKRGVILVSQEMVSARRGRSSAQIVGGPE